MSKQVFITANEVPSYLMDGYTCGVITEDGYTFTYDESGYLTDGSEYFEDAESIGVAVKFWVRK